MSFREDVTSGEFAVTTEIGPLKGTDTEEIKEVTELLKDKVSAANITDQQSSVMRLGSMATCHLVKNGGLDPIFQITCRDRNRIALQSDLLSAWVLGVESVLALTGDLPSLGDHPQAKGVYDLDSVQLLQVITELNLGKDMVGNELQGKPDLFPGAVVNPGADTEASMELQIIKMEKKIAAGAKFFQTQAVYDADVFANFMKRVEKFNVPILVGLIPLKSAGMARYMNKFVAGINVPDDIIESMTKTDDKVATSIEITAKLIKDMQDMCQGVHLMPLGWDKYVPKILEAAGV